MDPDMINCTILSIHVAKKKEKEFPSCAILRHISVRSRYGSKTNFKIDSSLTVIRKITGVSKPKEVPKESYSATEPQGITNN